MDDLNTLMRARLVVETLFCASAVCNPFIYNCFAIEFKTAFLNLSPFRKVQRRQPVPVEEEASDIGDDNDMVPMTTY